jgi:hypothetical protein
MLSNLFLYAANRATQGAVENVSRRASWGGFAIFLMLTGIIFSLIVVFWLLEARMGATSAGVIIAAGCFVVGLLSLSMPHLLDRIDAQAKKAPAPEPQTPITAAAVQQEMTDVVDYFGAIRVVASAFLLGLGMARRLKHPMA